MPVCLVALGSNRGDRDGWLDAAVAGLAELATDSPVESIRRSTVAVGGPSDQGIFVNSVVRFETTLTPEGLLRRCRTIEQLQGARNGVRWSARSLDLDLLAYDARILESSVLRLPHPRMSFRPFVLTPAAELAPDWIHPELNATLAELNRVLTVPPAVLAIVGQGDHAEQCGEITGEHLRGAEGARGKVSVVRQSAINAIDQTPAGLTIDATLEGVATKGPRLRVADCEPNRLSEEIGAAIACVWPAACIGPTETP